METPKQLDVVKVMQNQEKEQDIEKLDNNKEDNEKEHVTSKTNTKETTPKWLKPPIGVVKTKRFGIRNSIYTTSKNQRN